MRKMRMGMIGGGVGAFIGEVHRMAAQLDSQVELVCGAFSSHPERSLESGARYGIAAGRAYPSYQEMLEKEASLPPDVRMDFVSIVTPNHLHVPAAIAALRAGFPVVCDKPLASSLHDATSLLRVVRETSLPFALTHNYASYPMIRQARELVRSGRLGTIRKASAEYRQGWLSTPLEQSGQKQASWRTDPAQAGPTCCMGDIGTHAFHLLETITGQQVTQVCADLNTYVPGRLLEDDGSVLLRFNNGITGVLQASQVCSGEENSLRVSIHGTLGGLHWQQENPNQLHVLWQDRPRECWTPGTNHSDRLCPGAVDASRLPAGHPEGYLESFATLYREFVRHLRAFQGDPKAPVTDYPGITDGIRGMLFLEAILRNSNSAEKWSSLLPMELENSNRLMNPAP